MCNYRQELKEITIEAEVLKERNSRFESLFESMPNAFALHELILDAHGRPQDYRFHYINPAFTRQTGLPADLVGKTIREITPGIENTWIQRYGEVVLSGKPKSWEQYSSELGRYYRVHAFCPFDGYFGVLFDDVTEEVFKERRLIKSEAKLSKAIKVGKLGLFEFSLSRLELSADPTWYAITGLCGDLEDEQLYEEFINRVLPEYRDLVKSHMEAADKDSADRHQDENEFKFQHPVKGVIWMQIFSQVFSNGNRDNLIGYIREITKRKTIENDLRVSNQRLETLLTISEHQVEDFYSFLNYSLEKAIEFTNSEYGYFYLYDEDRREFTLSAWSKGAMAACKVQEPDTIYNLDDTGLWGEVVRQRKGIIVNEYNVSHPKAKGLPEGHVRISRWMSVPIFSEGIIVAVAGVADKDFDYEESDKDQFSQMMHSVWKIAESYTHKQQLVEAKEKAEEAAKAKTNFLANMSHEIRTPMNAIVGLVHLLKRNNLPQEVLGYLSKIESSSTTLLDIINDILDFSKIEANKIELEHIQFRPSSIFSQVNDVFSNLASEKGLILEMDFSADIPDVLLGDPLRLRQVLTNLLSNAIKFTDSGEIVLSAVPKSITVEHAEIEFSVRDTGIGMSPVQLGNVFESFSQADSSTTRYYGGTGLGLSISRHYVQLMGGEFNVESEPGQGSCFSFSLQFDRVDEVQSEGFDSSKRLTDPPDLSGGSILLVEDNELNRDVAEGLLEDTFARVLVAVNGEEAIQMVKKHKLDLVLMDVHMPVMDGLEATRNIRIWEIDEARSPVPIIAMTASAFTEDRQRCLDAGMTAHISKPIDPSEFFALLNSLRPSREASD